MRFLFYAFVFLLLCCASPARAADAGTEDALERIRSLTEAVDTLRCVFTQTTTIPLFVESVASEGILLFRKPASLVWEYTVPVPQGLVISGEEGFRWEEDRSRRVPFTTATDPVAGLVAAQMLAWIRFDRDWIESRYTVRREEGDGLAFILTPKQADMRSVLESLVIRFADDGIARTIVLKEANGGSTEIRLRDVVVNGPVHDREFR